MESKDAGNSLKAEMGSKSGCEEKCREKELWKSEPSRERLGSSHGDEFIQRAGMEGC